MTEKKTLKVGIAAPLVLDGPMTGAALCAFARRVAKSCSIGFRFGAAGLAWPAPLAAFRMR